MKFRMETLETQKLQNLKKIYVLTLAVLLIKILLISLPHRVVVKKVAKVAKKQQNIIIALGATSTINQDQDVINMRPDVKEK